jgi:hypothetical protein
MLEKFKIAARAYLRKTWFKYAEGIEVTRLPNGVEVVTHHIPRLFAFSFAPGVLGLTQKRMNEFTIMIQAGSGHERTRYPTGTAHLLEQVILYGSKSVPGIDEATQKIPGFSGKIGAFTAPDKTHFIVEAAPQKTQDAIFILSDLVSHPILSSEAIETDRPKVLAERVDGVMNEMKDNFNRFYQTAFEGKKGWSGIGTPASIQSITHQDVKGFWNTHYRSGRVVVAAEGKVRHKEFVEMVESYLSLSPGERQELSPAPYIGGYSGKEIPETPGVQIDLVFNCGPESPTNTTHVKVLAEKLYLPLYERLHREALAYDVKCDSGCIENLNVLKITCKTPADKARKTLEAVRDVLNIASGPIDDEPAARPLRDHARHPIQSFKAARAIYTHSKKDYIFHPLKSAYDLLLQRSCPRGTEDMAYALLHKGGIRSKNEELRTSLSTTRADMYAVALKMREQRPTLLATGNLSGMPDYKTVCDMFQIQPSEPAKLANGQRPNVELGRK